MRRLAARHVEVETGAYRRSHEAAPRGRGGWGFIMPDGSAWWAPADTLFGEAKRQAKAAAAEAGFHRCEVAP